MAVKFQNSPVSTPGPDFTLKGAYEGIRASLGLSDAVDIVVGATQVQAKFQGITFVLTGGLGAIKSNPNWAPSMRHQIDAMFKSPVGGSGFPTVAIGLPTKDPDYSDMDDQAWVEHVAGKLFPGSLHLHQTTELYQPVMGSSGGSIYKTCFIGPDLRIAARIKASTVSFRATTAGGSCPTGAVKATIQRLGVTNEYADRLTCHAAMSGPYDQANAHEYRAVFGAFYAALKPWITSNFPAIGKLAEGVK